MSHGGAPAPVTIGVPVFNGERFLAQALTSLRDQDFSDFEVLISDNASTDGTEEIARGFAAQDDRFSYSRTAENLGGARNSNLLLERCRSPYFRWAYYDDLNPPGLLGGLYRLLHEAGPEAVTAYPRVVLIDEQGTQIGRHDDADLDFNAELPSQRLAVLLRRVVGQIGYGLMRTEVVRATGGVPAAVAGEMVLPAALALRGKVLLLDDPPLHIRVHQTRHGGDRESEAAWVDPSRPRVAFPYSRSTPLLISTIRRARLEPGEELRCIQAVLWNWTRPGWKTIIGDLLRLPRDLQLVGR